jgi:site-specific DNA-methyltransferase (adenine-specific)
MPRVVKPSEWDYSPDVIVHGDCIAVMEAMPPESVDMVLCDLPYGTTQIDWDKMIPTNDLWRCYERVCKPNAAIVLTAAQPFSSQLTVSKPTWFKYEIIWVKNKATGHLNAKKQPMRAHENILVFYKQQPTYNPQMTSGHEPLHYAVNKQKTELYGAQKAVESRTGATDRYPKSVVHFDVVNNSDRVHETQKPVELFSYLIKTFSNPGDVILDNTAGGLTTAIACLATQRRYICIEQNADYISKALDRFPNDIFSE